MRTKVLKLKDKNKLQLDEGFTLIEILIVVVIAVMVFIPMYSFYASTIKFDTESRYEVVASNLAQEGIELCRNGRDSRILDGGDINGFDLGDCTNPPGISINGNQLGGTTFDRTCIVVPVEPDEIYKVSCTVEWESFASKENLIREVVAETILTDWGKNL